LKIAAYFDDSWYGGILAISGYIAPVELWANYFIPHWDRVLKSSARPVYEFKTSDCRSGGGIFRGWPEGERRELVEQLINVITSDEIKGNILGFGAAIVLPEPPNREDRKKWFDFSYLMCMALAAHSARQVLGEAFEARDTLEIILDNQPKLKGKAWELFKVIKEEVGKEYPGTILPLRFEDSASLAPLQAADLIANETFRELRRQMNNPHLARSPTLEALLDGQFHHAIYMDRDMMRRISNGNHEEGVYTFPTLYISLIE
jgi:hypothetical protein